MKCPRCNGKIVQDGYGQDEELICLLCGRPLNPPEPLALPVVRGGGDLRTWHGTSYRDRLDGTSRKPNLLPGPLPDRDRLKRKAQD